MQYIQCTNILWARYKTHYFGQMVSALHLLAGSNVCPSSLGSSSLESVALFV